MKTITQKEVKIDKKAKRKIIHESTKKENIEQNNKQKIIETIKSNLILIIGIILLLSKSILLNFLLELKIGIKVVIYTIMISALIMSPTINRKDKFAIKYLNISYFIVTLIIYINFLYYTYSTNFLSLYQIVNIQYAKEIGSGLTTIINIKDFITFFAVNIATIILSILICKKTKIKKKEKKNSYIKMILILIILVLNIYIIKEKIDNIYSEKKYNKSLIVQDASIYYYHIEDAKDYITSLITKESIDNEKLENAYNQNLKEKESSTNYTGIAQDSNVIILQLESLNEYIIGKSVNGKEIMPNLNKFFQENIYCNDMYNQGLGTTADSEFEMGNSMYPIENGYVFQKYYNNKWLDVYTELRKQGYFTSLMHPNTSRFWNREEVYKNGYHIDEFNDINKFKDIEMAGEFYSDEGFLEESVKIMNEYEGKFCATLVSVTTHIPFYLDGVSNLEEKLTLTQEDVSNYEDETYRNYLISCNFVDYAFGKFIKNLEETGLLEKSIVIVYGDHGAGLTSKKDIEKLYKENEMEYTEFEETTMDVHVPFGIKIPNLERSENIERVVSKIDIKPTILDLLGIEDKFSIGSSIFTNKDYTFIKGMGYITSENYCINERYYNRKSNEEIEETDELKKILEKMENEIYLSDTIIKNDMIESAN